MKNLAEADRLRKSPLCQREREKAARRDAGGKGTKRGAVVVFENLHPFSGSFDTSQP
jgi:hypothetical protein